jgi:hypothetical protein
MFVSVIDLRADDCESLQQSYLAGRNERMGPPNRYWRLEVEAESGFEGGAGGIIAFNNHDIKWYRLNRNYKVTTE